MWPIFRDKENTMKPCLSPNEQDELSNLPKNKPASLKHASAFHKNMPTKSTGFRNPGMWWKLCQWLPMVGVEQCIPLCCCVLNDFKETIVKGWW